MFEKAVQGAASFEILSAQGSNPLALWKVNAGVQRVYDKSLKGSVYQLLPNGAQAILQLPKEDKGKQSLGLMQPYLVLQVFLPANRERPFSLEVGVTDCSRTRRRLFFSALSHEAQTNPLHARFPLASVRRGTWLNLCLDIDSLLHGSFGHVMRSLDSVAVHSECRLRKIFTLRSLPHCDGEAAAPPEAPVAEPGEGAAADAGGGAPPDADRRAPELIPRSHDFPTGIEQHTQVIGAEQVFGLAAEEPPCHPRDDLGAGAEAPRPARDARGERAQQQPTPEAPAPAPPALGAEGAPARQDAPAGERPREDEAEEPRASASRASRGGAARAQAEPIGYEDMVRRGHQPEEAGQEERDAGACAAPEPAGAARRRVSLGALVPRACRASRSAEADGQAPPPPRAAAPPRAPAGAPAPPTPPVAGGAPAAGAVAGASAAPRRPKSQRRPESLQAVQARGPGDSGRRLPLSARAAERSSPPPRPGRARPLPLEAGSMRAAREDAGASMVQPLSSRRGRRLGHPSPKPGDEDSISPSPSAATRRRRDLAIKTLHKTAEVYGVSGVAHRHASLPKGAERGDEGRGAGGARAEEEAEADKFGTLSTLELPPEMTCPWRPAGLPAGEAQQPPRGLEDDVGEPPPAASPGAASGPLQMPSIVPPPGSPDALELPPAREPPALPHPVCPPKVPRPMLEAAPPASCTSQGSLPPVAVVEAAGAEARDARGAGGAVEASPGATPEAEEPSGGLCAGRWPGPLGRTREGGGGDAWSAFGATVRHLGGPPLSARFSGAHRQDSGSGAGGQPAGGGFELTFRPRVSAERRAPEAEEAPAAAEACGGAEAARESCRDGETARSHAASPEAAAEPDAPPPGGPPQCEGSPRSALSLSSEDPRRIKSLSPPRRWKRPQPFINLDKEGGERLAVLSAPSSAPSETEQRRLEPFAHPSEPSAPSCPRAAGRGGHGDEAPEGREPRDGGRAEAPRPIGEEAPPCAPSPRPFTPPVVSVGRLLAGRAGELLRGAARPLGAVDGGLAAAGRGGEAEAEAGGPMAAEGLYDPMLDMCYDPVGNRYYERRPWGEGLAGRAGGL